MVVVILVESVFQNAIDVGDSVLYNAIEVKESVVKAAVVVGVVDADAALHCENKPNDQLVEISAH